MEATIPMVSVTAKPFTGPVAFQNRINGGDKGGDV